MSTATEAQRRELRDSVGTFSRLLAGSVREVCGRNVRVLVVLADSDDLNIYSSAYELTRGELLGLLRQMIKSIEAREHSTRVMVGDRTVAEYEGKPS